MLLPRATPPRPSSVAPAVERSPVARAVGASTHSSHAHTPRPQASAWAARASTTTAAKGEKGTFTVAMADVPIRVSVNKNIDFRAQITNKSKHHLLQELVSIWPSRGLCRIQGAACCTHDLAHTSLVRSFA